MVTAENHVRTAAPGGPTPGSVHAEGMLAPFRWTRNVRRERIIGMPPTNIPERDGHGRSVRASRLSRFVLLAIGAYFCSNLALWAQTSDSQTGDANKSWTASSELHSDS